MNTLSNNLLDKASARTGHPYLAATRLPFPPTIPPFRSALVHLPAQWVSAEMLVPQSGLPDQHCGTVAPLVRSEAKLSIQASRSVLPEAVTWA